MNIKTSLDARYIALVKKRIEAQIVPAMESVYGSGGTRIPDSFRPGLKYLERVVSFYDYYACGISVLAPLAVKGDKRAGKLVDILLKNMDYYRTRIFRRPMVGVGLWQIPLRRLLFHAALAYRILEPGLTAKQRKAFRALLEQQTSAALEHNHYFHPGEKKLYLGFANNHMAIFMQGVYHSGLVLKKAGWVGMAREFAGRLFRSGHPDGYWEENTNTLREGGPSLIYTPLTAGSLYDVLDGCRHAQSKFVRAGEFYRSFLNHDGDLIPLADERTNAHGKHPVYGLALHSLTSAGRGHIRNLISWLDWKEQSPESLAVLYHELDLMRTGPCTVPEYQKQGVSRITLPLGVVRAHGWTAALSALRALNRVRQPNSDYALDHQNMAYLAHDRAGVILTGHKSKNDPEFSTFRCGIDAYPVDTGTLRIGKDWAQARLRYATFEAGLRFELGKRARLVLETEANREITTTLPITNPAHVRSDHACSVVKLKGFSPYSSGNASEPVTAVKFVWKKLLVIEFLPAGNGSAACSARP